MANHLPFEVLTIIGKHLYIKELSACMQVCHAWRKAFVPILYHDVEIRSGIQFDHFVETLESTKHDKLPLGHHVRILNLWFEAYGNDIKDLPPLCPFVVEIGVWDTQFQYIACEMHQWKHLATVPELILDQSPKFSFEFFKNIITDLVLDTLAEWYDEWMTIITRLPGVERLVIKGDYDRDQHFPKLSVSEMETIFESLPRLSHLELSYFYLYGDVPVHTSPCETLDILSLSPMDNHMWGRYFSKKCTKVGRLIVYGYSNDAAGMFAESKTLLRSCRCLKELEAGLATDEIRQCLAILAEIGAPMRSLDLYADWDLDSMSHVVHGFQRTVSKITLKIADGTMLQTRMMPLRRCASLTILTVDAMFQDIQLDAIMEACVHLKILKIVSKLLYLGSMPAATQLHSLERLTMKGIMGSEVFSYLSDAAPNITELVCSITLEGQSLSMDFPFMRLRRLYLRCSGQPLYRLILLDKILNGTKDTNDESNEWYRCYRGCPDDRYTLHTVSYGEKLGGCTCGFDSIVYPGESDRSSQEVALVSLRCRSIQDISIRPSTGSRYDF
ncbi:hypothetical protein EC973_007558 [Apophysomyces ossiformis]|uniref:F-box domain-containing protein n=1 Tax=Apophysomyces ossiformis TaxID=679940 RepID=A0A8H7EQU8_9FUNG|nr:hypothetical protein EC973_007558 [Apophysomyces ossiformis]